jgi:type VI secretion system secreted protein VgrG
MHDPLSTGAPPFEPTREDAGVSYQIEIDALSAAYDVRSVVLSEHIGQPYTATIEVRVADHGPPSRDLLGSDARVEMVSGSASRSIRGLIRECHLRESHDGVFLTLQLVPALWLLTQNRDSRIFQDMSAIEVVKSIYERMLGRRQRTLRIETRNAYPTYEYIVQYRESDHDFICRILERDGIFFYFDHDANETRHETLVLADDVRTLADVNAQRGIVRYHPFGAMGAISEESISHIAHSETLGASASMVRGHDWTRPALAVEDKAGAAEGQPLLRVYDHGSEARLHDYRSESYRANTVGEAARRIAARARGNRHHWRMSGSVVGARPGALIEVVGSDLDGASDLDGKYLVVGNEGRGRMTEGMEGAYANELVCVPVDADYVPPRSTPEPHVLGPETAIVVGPAGEEVHTDEHGRVKVQMHWDRQGRRDENSSAWFRVSQGWAGPGWGSIFLPRIGMEVIVSFLGGDPDRPVITGCLYNGDNRVPYELPKHKTRTTIKTNSSIDGKGYNELRFEDKLGEEEVWIHAQKDMNEVVENDHSTHVKHARTDTVDVDHTETIGNDQTYRVQNHRQSTVGRESIQVRGSRSVAVGGSESLRTRGTRDETVGHEYTTTVQEENRVIRVLDGTYDLHQKKGGFNKLVLEELGAWLFSQMRVRCSAGPDTDSDAAELTLDTSGDVALVSNETKVELKAKTSIILSVGDAASITITESEIHINAPTVRVTAENLVEVKGGLVKINCD